MRRGDYSQVFRRMSAPVRSSLRKIFVEHGKAVVGEALCESQDYGLTESRMFLDQFVQVWRA